MNVLEAIDAAHEQDMYVVLVTGRDGGQCARSLTAQDVEIRIGGGTAVQDHGIADKRVKIGTCLSDRA